MEILEMKDRKNFLASQFHAEFLSRPLNPSRLHLHFIKSALEFKQSKIALLEGGS